MRLTTRIITGYGLLFAIFAGLVLYVLVSVGRLHSLNHQITRDDYSYCVLCLQALGDLDKVEEYTWKSFALADEEVWNRLEEYRATFETSLNQLVRVAAQARQDDQATKRLIPIWNSYQAEIERHGNTASPGRSIAAPSLLQQLEELRIMIHSFYLSALQSIDLRVKDSQQIARRTVVLSILLALAATLCAAIVSILIYRSIALPLAQLTEGTRALAEGKVFYRLDTSRDDEFSQIAKDINKIILQANEHARAQQAKTDEK